MTRASERRSGQRQSRHTDFEDHSAGQDRQRRPAPSMAQAQKSRRRSASADCATSTVEPAADASLAQCGDQIDAEESCAHSATASAPPRSARILSTAERPTRPMAIIASVRPSVQVSVEWS